MTYTIYRIKHMIVLISLLLLTYQTHAQSSDSLTDFIDSSNLEAINLRVAFDDTTANDTLVFTQQNISNPNSFLEYEILNPTQVLDLILQESIITDSPSYIPAHTISFIEDQQVYEKIYSYGIQQKHFSHALINGNYVGNQDCLNISERITITSIDLPEPLVVTNDYYILLDPAKQPTHIIAYNEMLYDPVLFREKYFIQLSQSNSALKSYNKTNTEVPKHATSSEYLAVTPNPAQNSVRIQIMLEKAANAEIFITDMMGKKVTEIQQVNISGSTVYTYMQEITSLPSGIYTVTLHTSNTVLTSKLVVNK